MNSFNKIEQIHYILFKYILSHQKRPYLASFKSTYHCNLSCYQCPFYVIDTPDLSYQNSIEVMNKLYQRGNRAIIFEGGEPSLWRDHQYTIYDLVNAARERFICTGMTTNGTRPLDFPVDILWVSIDGFEQTHNYLRKANIFQKVISHIKDSQHPKLFAHITVNNLNYQEIPALIEFLSDIVRGITLQFYYPYNNQMDLYLDQKDRIETIDKIIQLKRNGYPIYNSVPSLKALKFNKWSCKDWLIDNANPDGTISQGCYLKGRSDIDCSKCGFSPHTEISLAFNLNPASILSGYKIFFSK